MQEPDLYREWIFKPMGRDGKNVSKFKGIILKSNYTSVE